MDDALGTDDAWALRERLHRREVHPTELVQAARDRLVAAQHLNAVVCELDLPGLPHSEAPLSGIPTVIKDTDNVAGIPTLQGSAALPPVPATADSPWVAQFRRLGVHPIAKTTMPEFGLTATTETLGFGATRNPWNTDYSVGGSSGGSAALVAAGVVPIAHANDGGGSIRIPAAACGLVGLKPTRGRIVDVPELDRLPVNLVAQGVVSRSVRDTALYLHAAEMDFRNADLPPIGLVTGPSRERLRIAVLTESVRRLPLDGDTRRAVEEAARTLEELGHKVEPVGQEVPDQFADDFLRYWAFLAGTITFFNGRLLGIEGFDAQRVEPFTRGLRGLLLQQLERVPGALRRLRRAAAGPEPYSDRFDVVISPVLGHPAPRIGVLGPEVPFRTYLARLARYSSFTPLANVTGAPAMSLPLGRTCDGRPIGVHFSAARGNEAQLLSLAYELEEALPWPRTAGAQ